MLTNMGAGPREAKAILGPDLCRKMSRGGILERGGWLVAGKGVDRKDSRVMVSNQKVGSRALMLPQPGPEYGSYREVEGGLVLGILVHRSSAAGEEHETREREGGEWSVGRSAVHTMLREYRAAAGGNGSHRGRL